MRRPHRLLGPLALILLVLTVAMPAAGALGPTSTKEPGRPTGAGPVQNEESAAESALAIQAHSTSEANQPDAGFWVRGQVEYLDISVEHGSCGDAEYLPARQVFVEVWEEDGLEIFGISTDDLEGYTFTDDDGNYELYISNSYEQNGTLKEVYVVVHAVNPAGFVRNRTDRELYVLRSWTYPGGSDLNIPISVVDTAYSGILNILDVMLDAREVFDQYYSDPAGIKIYHEPGYGEDRTYYHWERDWLGDTNRYICIGDANPYMGHNDGVILHEYGHYAADLYTCDDSPGGNHSLGGHYTPELTWSEGWAHFFSATTRGSRYYYRLDDNANCYLSADWETWSVEGFDNEGAVASILWDIYDYSGSNEAHDRIARGEDPIWEVIDTTGGWDSCDIVGLYGDWLQTYPEDGVSVASIMGHYRTPYIWHRHEWSQEVPWPGMIFVVDATQSMDDNIDHVKGSILAVTDMFDASDNPYEYALETFGDMTSTVEAHSFFVDVIAPAVEGITVGGGGDLAENSLGALNRAAGRYGALNYTISTDAPAKDLQWGRKGADGAPADPAAPQNAVQGLGGMEILLSRLQRKGALVNVIFYGQCNDPNAAGAASPSPSALEDCLEPYQQVADATNGNLITLNYGGKAAQQTDALAAVLYALTTDGASSGRTLYTVNSSSWDYIWDDVDYDWYDATGGTYHQVTDRKAVALPQSFSFYNAPYNTVYIGRPGYASFSDFGAVAANTGLPTPALPNNAIYAFWDDITNIINRGEGPQARTPGIYTDYDGTDNRFVIEYHDNYHAGIVPTIHENLEIILDLDTDEIILQYAEVGDDSSMTIGVENATGSLGTEVAYDEPGFLYPGRAIKFTPVPMGPQEHEVLVDSTMASAGFLLNTRQGSTSLTLYRPGGTPVDPSDPDVTYLAAGGVEYYRVEGPAAGTWTASVAGDGSYYFTSTSDSPLTAEYSGDTLLPLANNLIVLDLGMSLTVQPSFALVDVRGTIADTLNLYDDGAHGDGEANDGVYGGTYSAPSAGAFYLQAEGQTPAGEPFLRFSPAAITFQRMLVTGPASPRFAAPGDTGTHWFGYNNGDPFTRTFTVEVNSSQGWSSQDPYTVTLFPGEWGLLGLAYAVPADAWGLVDETIVAVHGEGLTDYAALTTLVRGPAMTVTQWAYPPVVEPNGDQATIVALVDDAAHWPVVDGAVVSFQTSLGTIDPITATTVEGTVTATLTSGAETGFARVVATVDGVTDVITVEIRLPALHSITLEAEDHRLPPDGTSTTVLTARVYDEYGGPAPDATTVIFALNGEDEAMGTIEGGAIYTATTSGGAATATFRSGTTTGLSTIRAVVPLEGGLSGEGVGIIDRLWAVAVIRLTFGYDIFLPIVYRNTPP